jgi:hypothetical protein
MFMAPIVCPISAAAFFRKSYQKKARFASLAGPNGQPQLSDDQVKYAALDAYISYEIFKAIQNGGDPRLDPPPSNTPNPGTRVLLFTQNKAECIAMGSIVDHQSPDFGGLPLFPSGRGKRVVVQLDPTSIYVGGALSQYPPRSGSSCLPLSECHLVLWDLDCIRPDSPSAQRLRESLEDTIGSIEDNIKTNSEDELTDIDSDDFMVSDRIRIIDFRIFTYEKLSESDTILYYPIVSDGYFRIRIVIFTFL